MSVKALGERLLPQTGPTERTPGLIQWIRGGRAQKGARFRGTFLGTAVPLKTWELGLVAQPFRALFLNAHRDRL